MKRIWGFVSREIGGFSFSVSVTDSTGISSAGDSMTEHFKLFATLVTSLGMVLCMPLFHWLGVSDAVILLLATLSQIATRITYGLSIEPWMFYLGL